MSDDPDRDENPSIRLEEFLPYRLSLLANTVSNAMAEIYRDRFGLSIPDWRVLAVLARFPGSSAQDLVEHTRMDKVAVSRSVARLTERQLILRQTSDSDRRRSELKLSAAGRAMYAEIAPLALDYERQLLDALGEEHLAVLENLLAELQQAAESLAN
jgi:DNA-binding MarR family transcriptional regulator